MREEACLLLLEGPCCWLVVERVACCWVVAERVACCWLVVERVACCWLVVERVACHAVVLPLSFFCTLLYASAGLLLRQARGRRVAWRVPSAGPLLRQAPDGVAVRAHWCCAQPIRALPYASAAWPTAVHLLGVALMVAAGGGI